MKPRGKAQRVRARRLALGVSAVVTAAVVFELGRSAFAFRPTVQADDYESLARARAQSSFADAPVYIGQRWLDPQARMGWPELAQPRWFARPDIETVPTFWVLDHRSSRGPTLPRAIAEDLEPGLPKPLRVERHRSGGLTLTRYERANARELVGDLGDATITATLDGATCKGKIEGGAGQISCGGRPSSATIRWTEVEVDFRPRSCLAIDLPGGGTLDLSAPDLALATDVVGHLGFGDFNDRIRNDAPASLELSHDGEALMRAMVSDEQGWHRFEASGVPASETGLDVRLRMAPAGTWKGDGPGQRDVKTACLELRAVGEVTP